MKKLTIIAAFVLGAYATAQTISRTPWVSNLGATFSSEAKCIADVSKRAAGVYTCSKVTRITVPTPTPTPTPTPSPTPTPTSLMPYVDKTKLMVPVVGESRELLSLTSEKPATGADVAFRTACTPSHMNFDDPIVFPGQTGASHLHLFFGNTRTNALTNADTLMNLGNSTCRGGIANRTAYWVPAMIDTRTGTPIVPTIEHSYYKQGGVDFRIIKPFPTGLRMIAGDAKATADGPGIATFSCEELPAGSPRMAGATIQNCPAGSQLFQGVVFPQCWDGINLDSPDHKSHMAYPSGGKCPASHPVAGPEIATNVVYDIKPGDDLTKWKLSSDNYTGKGGYSNHSDWFNGWKPDVMKAFVEGCLNKGADCHSHLLGDGRQIE